METFNELLTLWQPFFSAVATVASTLAGLLFVALTINREKITAQNDGILLRLAKRSFGDLLYVLFIALMFLIPNHHPYGLAIPLFCVAATRGWLFIRSSFQSRKGQATRPAQFGVVREQAFEIIPCLGLLAAGLEIYRGVVLATFFLVPVIALLLYNASMNAWLLLIMEKEAPLAPSPAPVPARDDVRSI